MDEFTNPHRKVTIVMKSSRSGLTAALVENGIGYHIHYDPCPILLAVPDKSGAERFARDNLDPMIRDTPVLSERVLPARVKGSDTTKLYKKFKGGSVKLTWATSPKGFRASTIRVFMGDDIDGFPLSAGLEGDPFTLGKRRTATVWNAKVIGISSPTVTGISRIEVEFGLSDQRHYYVPCPRCKHKQVLVFSKNSIFSKPTNGNIIGDLSKGYLKFDSANCTWAHYVCENCHYEIEDSQKARMVDRGEWRAARPEVTDVAGFHISELYSTFNTTWLRVAKEFLESNHDSQKLKVFVNNVLGETFDEDAFTVSDNALMDRLEDYEGIPDGVYFITAGVDIQAAPARVEVSVWGWGEADCSWLIDYKVINGNFNDAITKEALNDYLLTPFTHSSGMKKRIDFAFVDAGYLTTEVFSFTGAREREGRYVYATFGRSGVRPLVKPERKRDRRTGAHHFILGVDEAKARVYDRLGKQPPSDPRMNFPQGYVHLNKKATFDFVRGLVSERRVRKLSKGRPVSVWELPSGRRNEPLDTAVMALCAREYLPLNMTKLKAQTEAKIAAAKQAPVGTETTVVESKIPKRRSGVRVAGRFR